MIKGLMSGVLGILLGTVGLDLVTSYPRFTFGSFELESGIQLVPAMIGLFSISQVMISIEGIAKGRTKVVQGDAADLLKGSPFPTWGEFKSCIPTFCTSSIIGLLVGILPGAGGDIGSWVAYNTAKKHSRHPETFGKGEIEGVAASETANNAVTGGALIPLMNCPVILVGKEDPVNTRKFNYRDFALLANQVTDYNVMAWRKDETRWHDFASFVEYAKNNELLYGSSGTGLVSDDDTAAQMINRTMGTKLKVVVTKGAKDNETMLLNKSTDILIGNIGDVLAGSKAGTFKVGCVFAPERSALLPDVPTAKEQTGTELNCQSSRGYAFPKGVDQEIVDKMTAALEKAIKNPDTIAKLAAMGQETNCVAGEAYYAYLDTMRDNILATFGLKRVD